MSGQEWLYDYTVAGSLSAGDDVAIYFPYATSSSLTDLGTGGSDWSTFMLQPDTSVPADGEYDLVATTISVSTARACGLNSACSKASPSRRAITITRCGAIRLRITAASSNRNGANE